MSVNKQWLANSMFCPVLMSEKSKKKENRKVDTSELHEEDCKEN